MMVNLKKVASSRLAGIIFWWFISFWRVCKKQEKFESFVCTIICLTAISAFLTYKERLDLRQFIILYILLGIVFSSKFFWKNVEKIISSNKEIAQ